MKLLTSRVKSPKIDEAPQMAISESRRTRQTFVQLIPHDVLCLIVVALEILWCTCCCWRAQR